MRYSPVNLRVLTVLAICCFGLGNGCGTSDPSTLAAGNTPPTITNLGSLVRALGGNNYELRARLATALGSSAFLEISDPNSSTTLTVNTSAATTLSGGLTDANDGITVQGQAPTPLTRVGSATPLMLNITGTLQRAGSERFAVTISDGVAPNLVLQLDVVVIETDLVNSAGPVGATVTRKANGDYEAQQLVTQTNISLPFTATGLDLNGQLTVTMEIDSAATSVFYNSKLNPAPANPFTALGLTITPAPVIAAGKATLSRPHNGAVTFSGTIVDPDAGTPKPAHVFIKVTVKEPAPTLVSKSLTIDIVVKPPPEIPVLTLAANTGLSTPTVTEPTTRNYETTVAFGGTLSVVFNGDGDTAAPGGVSGVIDLDPTFSLANFYPGFQLGTASGTSNFKLEFGAAPMGNSPFSTSFGTRNFSFTIRSTELPQPPPGSTAPGQFKLRITLSQTGANPGNIVATLKVTVSPPPPTPDVLLIASKSWTQVGGSFDTQYSGWRNPTATSFTTVFNSPLPGGLSFTLPRTDPAAVPVVAKLTLRLVLDTSRSSPGYTTLFNSGLTFTGGTLSASEVTAIGTGAQNTVQISTTGTPAFSGFLFFALDAWGEDANGSLVGSRLRATVLYRIFDTPPAFLFNKSLGYTLNSVHAQDDGTGKEAQAWIGGASGGASKMTHLIDSPVRNPIEVDQGALLGNSILKVVGKPRDSASGRWETVVPGANTVLTDTDANWPVNYWQGVRIQPNTSVGKLFTVASNTATTITITGNLLTLFDTDQNAALSAVEQQANFNTFGRQINAGTEAWEAVAFDRANSRTYFFDDQLPVTAALSNPDNEYFDFQVMPDQADTLRREYPVLGNHRARALTGTVTVNNNSTTVTGVGTAFTTELQAGDTVMMGDPALFNGSNVQYKFRRIVQIASDTQCTLDTVWDAGFTLPAGNRMFKTLVRSLQGTVSVTAGATAVTGVGTRFTLDGILVGDPIIINGEVHRINAFTDTTITLNRNHTSGATGVLVLAPIIRRFGGGVTFATAANSTAVTSSIDISAQLAPGDAIQIGQESHTIAAVAGVNITLGQNHGITNAALQGFKLTHSVTINGNLNLLSDPPVASDTYFMMGRKPSTAAALVDTNADSQGDSILISINADSTAAAAWTTATFSPVLTASDVILDIILDKNQVPATPGHVVVAIVGNASRGMRTYKFATSAAGTFIFNGTSLAVPGAVSVSTTAQTIATSFAVAGTWRTAKGSALVVGDVFTIQNTTDFTGMELFLAKGGNLAIGDQFAVTSVTAGAESVICVTSNQNLVVYEGRWTTVTSGANSVLGDNGQQWLNSELDGYLLLPDITQAALLRVIGATASSAGANPSRVTVNGFDAGAAGVAVGDFYRVLGVPKGRRVESLSSVTFKPADNANGPQTGWILAQFDDNRHQLYRTVPDRNAAGAQTTWSSFWVPVQGAFLFSAAKISDFAYVSPSGNRTTDAWFIALGETIPNVYQFEPDNNDPFKGALNKISTFPNLTTNAGTGVIRAVSPVPGLGDSLFYAADQANFYRSDLLGGGETFTQLAGQLPPDFATANLNPSNLLDVSVASPSYAIILNNNQRYCRFGGRDENILPDVFITDIRSPNPGTSVELTLNGFGHPPITFGIGGTMTGNTQSRAQTDWVTSGIYKVIGLNTNKITWLSNWDPFVYDAEPYNRTLSTPIVQDWIGNLYCTPRLVGTVNQACAAGFVGAFATTPAAATMADLLVVGDSVIIDQVFYTVNAVAANNLTLTEPMASLFFGAANHNGQNIHRAAPWQFHANGNITVTQTTATTIDVTGPAAARFTRDAAVGDFIEIERSPADPTKRVYFQVASIGSDTAMTLTGKHPDLAVSQTIVNTTILNRGKQVTYRLNIQIATHGSGPTPQNTKIVESSSDDNFSSDGIFVLNPRAIQRCDFSGPWRVPRGWAIETASVLYPNGQKAGWVHSTQAPPPVTDVDTEVFNGLKRRRATVGVSSSADGYLIVDSDAFFTGAAGDLGNIDTSFYSPVMDATAGANATANFSFRYRAYFLGGNATLEARRWLVLVDPGTQDVLKGALRWSDWVQIRSYNSTVNDWTADNATVDFNSGLFTPLNTLLWNAFDVSGAPGAAGFADHAFASRYCQFRLRFNEATWAGWWLVDDIVVTP